MTDWHSRHGGLEWRVTPAGIETRDAGGVVCLERTAGEPTSCRLYLALWRREILAAAESEGVPVTLLLMTVAVENGAARVSGQRLWNSGPRYEPGYVSDEATPHRISCGPCHVLLSTAAELAGRPVTRTELLDPARNLQLAARYIAQRRSVTGYDPILVAASYNAGSIRPGNNRWRLHAWGDHLDRAARWYGDACAVVQESVDLATLDARGLGRVVT